MQSGLNNPTFLASMLVELRLILHKLANISSKLLAKTKSCAIFPQMINSVASYNVHILVIKLTSAS